MTPKKFITKYKPCAEGSAFITRHATLSEAWENCTRPDWMFWLLENVRPLDKRQAVTLAIQFARACAGYSKDHRVLAALDKAQAWLDSPSKEAEAAASAAADAAARAADAAARAAARAADAAARAAASAAAFAAHAAARAASVAAHAAARAAAHAAARAAARAASVAAHAAAFAAAHAAADHAARAAAHAARVSQCGIIRQSIPNPFQS